MSETPDTTQEHTPNVQHEPKKATTLIVVGMAGSGKTTFMQVC